MAQNDNQRQENRAFKKEDAYETLGIPKGGQHAAAISTLKETVTLKTGASSF